MKKPTLVSVIDFGDAYLADEMNVYIAKKEKEIQELKLINKNSNKVLADKCDALSECSKKSVKEIEGLRESLENIIEYWNKDRNDKAMHDALWYMIGEAEQALTGEG